MHVALVDSEREELTVFHLGSRGFGPGRRPAAGREFESRVLPGFSFRVGDLFADL